MNKDGLLAIADGGTIFLDEVGELPVDLQAKLLRALQEKEVRPVGGTKSVPIDVRILAATNRDLEQAVAPGTFRRDLYFRLNVLTLRIPRCASRKQDIPLLVGHFLERMTRTTGVQRNISDDALKLMLAYDWPGNIRELENCIQRACALTSRCRPFISPICPPRYRTGGSRANAAAAEHANAVTAFCRSRRWKSTPFWAPSSSCTATSWRRRACWESARPPCIAN